MKKKLETQKKIKRIREKNKRELKKIKEKQRKIERQIKKLNKEKIRLEKKKRKIEEKVIIKRTIYKKKPKERVIIKREIYKKPIRKQFVLNLRHEYIEELNKNFPYFISIRAVTLNPNISLNYLKNIVAEIYLDLSRQYDLSNHEKETKDYVAVENKAIDIAEEKALLKNQNIYIEILINGKVTDFYYINP